MRFKIEKEQPYILQVGDIVIAKKNVGSVCEEEGQFIIRHIFDSKYGFTGKHQNLKILTESLNSLDNVQIFSKDDYELVLKKKTNSLGGLIIHG